MFGIGLPELILIMAIALIVVGPDRLPDLAKTVAKQLLELKKAAGTLKDTLQEEMNKETTAETKPESEHKLARQPEYDGINPAGQTPELPESGVNPTHLEAGQENDPLPPGSSRPAG